MLLIINVSIIFIIVIYSRLAIWFETINEKYREKEPEESLQVSWQYKGVFQKHKLMVNDKHSQVA